MLRLLKPELRKQYSPGLRNGSASGLVARWRAELRDRVLWKRWAVFVLAPMLLAESILAVLKFNKHLTAHAFDLWSEFICVACVLASQQLNASAIKRRRTAAETTQ